MAFSFYWRNYETWDAEPRRDRGSLLAGLRTDESLNPVGDPLVVYCKPRGVTALPVGMVSTGRKTTGV